VNKIVGQRMKVILQIALVLVLFIAGFFVGCLIWFLALGLGGAGHGWGAASVSMTSIVGGPAAILGWIYRKKAVGRALSICALIIAIGTDAVLFFQTASEGFSYFARVWTSLPEWLLAWACLFLAWQILAASALNRKKPNQAT
jgi:hypothetical protein